MYVRRLGNAGYGTIEAVDMRSMVNSLVGVRCVCV
jgi:hypothetical protein